MRGKYVNLSLGFLNIVFGILIIIFQIYVPQDIKDLTLQEITVSNYISTAIKVLTVIVTIIDLIAMMSNKDESKFKSGYRTAIFVISYFIIPKFFIGLFPIIGGIIVINKIMRANLVELDSTFALSIILLVFVLVFASIFACFIYKYLGQYIYKNQNKGEQSYSDDFFKYITPLDTDDVYINLKIDGKYGYINQSGEIVINFEYDFASPFIDINIYNKPFQIALVSKDEKSSIIMKNKRVVKSYISEIANDDYNAKIQELEKFYKNELNQDGDMQFEIKKLTDKKNKAIAYEGFSEQYTYKYNFNSDYDIEVIKSNMGLRRYILFS